MTADVTTEAESTENNATDEQKQEEGAAEEEGKEDLVTSTTDIEKSNPENLPSPEENRNEDDDVPADFFDDFSNKDFLAGLDVVDAWDDAENQNESPNETVDDNFQQNLQNAESLKETDTRRKPNKIQSKKMDGNNDRRKLDGNSDRRKVVGGDGNEDRRKGDENGDRRNRKFDEFNKDRKRPPSRDRRYMRYRRSQSHGRRSHSRERRSRSRDGVRRDPNKTKRDIQRDKVKCAKDKEAKIVSEKLRFVETGLVPPGMEMDVDLNEMQSNEEQRSRSAERQKKRPPSRSPSPNKNTRRRYRSPARYASPCRRRNSPNRRSPPRFNRYNKRSRTRSPVSKRERSLERNLPRHLAEQRNWSPSPPPDFFRSPRSSQSRISKELSPSRKRAQSFLDELGEKLSIREEQNKLRDIQQKINGGPSVSEILHKYAPVPAPVPTAITCMPNMHYQPNMYDQQFFIGVPEPQNYRPMPVAPPQEFTHQQPMYMNPISNMNPMPNINPNLNMNTNPNLNPMMNPNPIMNPNSNMHPNPNMNLSYPPRPVHQQKSELNQESVMNLFKDDKITLSNFFSITQRVSDKTKPLELKSRIKVITRCQDAIQLLTENSKPTGRFFNKKPIRPEPDKQADGKYASPMKKVPPVRYHFTTKTRQLEEQLITPMSRLLLKLGLKEPLPVPHESPLPLKRHEALPKNVIMKMTQTDPVKCDECEFRKKKKYVDVGVQCGSSSSSSFACQVSEDDFLNTARSALKNILKNQSLASLTPAQIMAQLATKPEEKKDIFPAARKLSEDSSPEKKIPRPGGISNNDSFQYRSDFERRGADFPNRDYFNPNFSNPQRNFPSNFANPSYPNKFSNPGSFANNPNPNFRNTNLGASSSLLGPGPSTFGPISSNFRPSSSFGPSSNNFTPNSSTFGLNNPRNRFNNNQGNMF